VPHAAAELNQTTSALTQKSIALNLLFFCGDADNRIRMRFVSHIAIRSAFGRQRDATPRIHRTFLRPVTKSGGRGGTDDWIGSNAESAPASPWELGDATLKVANNPIMQLLQLSHTRMARMRVESAVALGCMLSGRRVFRLCAEKKMPTVERE
jgi:hypothetical protein